MQYQNTDPAFMRDLEFIKVMRRTGIEPVTLGLKALMSVWPS
jgi:hypothetical protein